MTNANCIAHGRQHFTNAIKTIGKGNQKAIQSSTVHMAFVRIGTIYDLEGDLKEMSPEGKLRERKSLVGESLVWVKEVFQTSDDRVDKA